MDELFDRQWPKARISFDFMSCAACRNPIVTHPYLEEKLAPLLALKAAVVKLAVGRLAQDGLDASSDELSAWDGDLEKASMSRYVYKMCTKCKVPFFAGAVDCAQIAEAEEAKESVVCEGCLSPEGVPSCELHGTDYIQWKCRYCCSLSTYECFGYLHVCENCHPCPPLNSLMDFGMSDENGHYPNMKKIHEYHACPVYTGYKTMQEQTTELQARANPLHAQVTSLAGELEALDSLLLEKVAAVESILPIDTDLRGDAATHQAVLLERAVTHLEGLRDRSVRVWVSFEPASEAGNSELPEAYGQDFGAVFAAEAAAEDGQGQQWGWRDHANTCNPSSTACVANLTQATKSHAGIPTSVLRHAVPLPAGGATWICQAPPAKYKISVGLVSGKLAFPPPTDAALQRSASEDERRAVQGDSISSLFHDLEEDAELSFDSLEEDIDAGQRVVRVNGRLMPSAGLGHRLVPYEIELDTGLYEKTPYAGRIEIEVSGSNKPTAICYVQIQTDEARTLEILEDAVQTLVEQTASRNEKKKKHDRIREKISDIEQALAVVDCCPLGVIHPPSGIEHCLGCSMCNMLQEEEASKLLEATKKKEQNRKRNSERKQRKREAKEEALPAAADRNLKGEAMLELAGEGGDPGELTVDEDAAILLFVMKHAPQVFLRQWHEALRDPERVGEAYVAFLKKHGPEALRAGVTTKAAVCKVLAANANGEWLRQNGLAGKNASAKKSVEEVGAAWTRYFGGFGLRWSLLDL